MMSSYTAVYSDYNTIKLRPNTESLTIQNILSYQKNTDNYIDLIIRQRVGNTDVNGYDIILPLQGIKNRINHNTKTISFAIDGTIQKLADDHVIAQYRYDTAANAESLKQADEAILQYVQYRFPDGVIPLDGTMIYPGV